MGRVYDDHNEVAEFFIRIPLDMIQLTEKNGKVYPLAFEWVENGETVNVQIDSVKGVIPCAELKSGAVGDRYDCEINGKREYIYYSIKKPHKWFRVVKVTEDVYNEYYKLPNE